MSRGAEHTTGTQKQKAVIKAARTIAQNLHAASLAQKLEPGLACAQTMLLHLWSLPWPVGFGGAWAVKPYDLQPFMGSNKVKIPNFRI